ncbi:MAG: glycosyltransferase [Lachnospiraceae bacterium]|nr:glycosyltransferase [Lachnospiraceae bacterium]
MKRIAFFIQHMLGGGVEKSLISLTNYLIEKGNSVTVYMMRKEGPFLSLFHPSVRLKAIPMPRSVSDILPVGGTKVAVKENLDRGHYFTAFRLLSRRLVHRAEFAELDVDFRKIPALKEKYDIAVNYHLHAPFLLRYVKEKVEAPVKYAWIHNDFSSTDYHIEKLARYLNVYRYFFCVSQQVQKEFAQICPRLGKRSRVALNLLPRDEILEKSEEGFPREFRTVPKDCLKILSVGRLEWQKGFDIAIEVGRILLCRGDSFCWFVVGEGVERRKLEKLIRKNGLQGRFRLLGLRMNPYPYYRNADLYVQTSRHEGYGITLAEAKIFHLPIVCTDVAGAREQIKDGVTGDIAEIEAAEIAKKLHKLILDEDRRFAFKEKLMENEYQNNAEWLSAFD